MRRRDHSLRSQVVIESEPDCLFGHFDRILMMSDSVAGVKSQEVTVGRKR